MSIFGIDSWRLMYSALGNSRSAQEKLVSYETSFR
jgi:hypothetical protein